MPSQPSSFSLKPPPVHRARASSSSVRPPLSIATLEPRGILPASPAVVEDVPLSSTTVDSRAQDPTAAFASQHPSGISYQAVLGQPSSSSTTSTISPSSISSTSSTSSMFPVLVRRTVDLWFVLRHGGSGKHAVLLDTPDCSPRSSTDTEYILPLSSSPQKAAFAPEDFATAPQLRTQSRLVSFSSAHAPLLLVVIMFPLSTAVTLLCLSTLPITFAWPSTLSDLAHVGRDLNLYAQSGLLQTLHILGVLSVSAVWKHAWSIPGSVLWNVLAGALFHPLLATLVMTVLTTIGSVLSTLLATPLAPILTRFFPKAVELTRAALEGSSSPSLTSSSAASPTSTLTEVKDTINRTDSSSARGTSAWVRLSVLRLIGIVPWSGLNIACGLTGVALRDCALGAFIGTLPWTAVTCQIGDILQTFGRVSSTVAVGVDAQPATIQSVLTQPSVLLELVFLSVLSLAPILGRDRLRRFVTPLEDEANDKESNTSMSEKIASTSSKREDERVNLGICDRRGRPDGRQRWTWKRVSASVTRWSALNSPIRTSFSNDVHNGR